MNYEVREKLQYGSGSKEGFVEFVPSEDMWYKGDKSLEKLVSITLSSDYRFVTLKAQGNDGQFIETKYDLSKLEDIDNFFSAYREYEPYFAPIIEENIILENYETN